MNAGSKRFHNGNGATSWLPILEKELRRRDAKERKASTGPREEGVDPDIADIKLGPQPLAEWQVEE